MMSLHAVAPRGDRAALADLRTLDDGLAALRADGGWFEIIAEHLIRTPPVGAYRQAALKALELAALE